MKKFMGFLGSLLLIATLLVSCNNSLSAPNTNGAPTRSISMAGNEPASGRGAGVVNTAGRLQVIGNQVRGSLMPDEQISLIGMSFFWSNWAGDYYTADQVNKLVDDFEVSLVRAAYGVPHNGHPDGDYSKIERVVEAAIARDIYVLIDWHTEGDAWHFENEAKDFFHHFAGKYGDYPHVLYEVWNEPIDSGTDSLSRWASTMAGVIRQHDPDNLIICGSDTWSQYPNSYTINDPNVAYTFHGYFDDPNNGAVHRQQFYKNVDDAMNKGSAVFVTEFGSHYGTNGGTSEIMDACIERGISMAAWSVNHKVEPWSIYNGFNGPLTDIGRFYQQRMSSWPEIIPPPPPEPIDVFAGQVTRVQAEDYYIGSGVQKESKAAADGQNVGYIDSGDTMDYFLDVHAAGVYDVTFRVAAKENQGGFAFGSYGNVVVPQTNGWGETAAEWTTVTLNAVNLPQGEQHVVINANASGWNIDWMEFAPSGSAPVVEAGADQAIVSPVSAVILSGSATDSDGSIVSYTWEQIDGPAVNIETANAAQTVVSGLTSVDEYVFQLTAVDNDGLTGSDTVNVTVTDGKPVANAGGNTTIINPVADVTLNGSASSDPDGTIVSYQWAGPNGFTASGAVVTVAGLVVSQVTDFVYTLTVTDNDGKQDSAQVTVTVKPESNERVVAIKSAINGQYLCADDNGNATVVANRGAVGGWEQFDMIPQGNGQVAFRSHANGKYLTAALDLGNGEVIARADVVDTWELFTLEEQADGSVHIKAAANGKYLVNEMYDGNKIVARSDWPDTWEKFYIEIQ